MPERYLPSLAFKPYTSTYVGNANQEVAQLGQVLNQRYDDNIAKYDKLDEYINQINVNDVDRDLKTGLINDTRAAIGNIATNGNWEDAKVPLREVARRLANDHVINVAQQNYQTKQELDKQRLAAAVNGKTLIQFKDYSNTPTVDPNTGRATPLSLDGVYEGKLDTLQKMREIFADVNPDSFAYKNSSPQRDEETGQIYQVGSGSSKRFLSKQKIQEVANRSFDNFLGTAEGQQRLRVLTSKNSENGAPVDAATARKQIKNELLSTGMNKVFSDVSSESTDKLAPGQGGKGKKAKDGTEDYRLTSDNAYQQSQPIGDLISSLTKRDGTRIQDAQSVGGYFLGKGLKALEENGVLKPLPGKTSAFKSVYGEIPSNMKDTYNSLTKVFGNIKDETKRNTAIQNYLKNVQNGKIQPKYFAYGTTEKINNENNYIRNNNLDGRVFLDPDTHEVLSWKQVRDKYKNEAGNKLSNEDLKGATVSGEYSEDNPFVEMTGNNRFVSPQKLNIGGHKFILGSDEQEVQSPNFAIKVMSNGITRAARTGLPVKFNGGLSIIPKDNGFLIQDEKGNLRGDNQGKEFSLEDVQKLMYSTGNIRPKE